ncbi:hypothetical protein [Bacillus rhizoplanae]|uniref:hypothetical protein n=1 Tax=Bacillus rhizoplanae TaxID=2880966 RepID=UPI003D1B3919
MEKEKRNWLSLLDSACFLLLDTLSVGMIAVFNLQNGIYTELNYVTFVFVILLLLFSGIMGITEKEERFEKFGYLYFGCAFLFICAGLLLIW